MKTFIFFCFLFRGLLILSGLSEALQRKHCHSYWWTIWWDAFNQSLGPNHLTWFPASTWRDFSLRVTCSAPKLARSHGLINCLVTCSTARRVLWGGNGVFKLEESKIHRLEWRNLRTYNSSSVVVWQELPIWLRPVKSWTPTSHFLPPVWPTDRPHVSSGSGHRKRVFSKTHCWVARALLSGDL